MKSSVFRSEVAHSLANQYRQNWNMLRQAIRNVPDNRWTHGTDDTAWFFSLTAYHIIETADFYSRDNYKDMEWGKRLGMVNWWDHITPREAAQKFGKEDVLAYIRTINRRLAKILRNSTTNALLKKDGFYWFSSKLEKLQYLLRHNMYHLGELALQLRAWGCKRLKWT